MASTSSKVEENNDCLGPEDDDFFETYQAIVQKLKKRFLKKPNFAIVSEELEKLGAKWEGNEHYTYAATCYMTAARCQSNLGRAMEELNLLIRAGRLFLKVQKKAEKLRFIAISKHEVWSAMDCFDQAISLCEKTDGFKIMGAVLAMEMATSLGATPSGLDYANKSVKQYSTVAGIKKLASYHIELDDFHSALELISELVRRIESQFPHKDLGAYYRDLLRECEITRILLLLILKPPPQSMKPEYSLLLEKYVWENDSKINVPEMNEELKILVQSFVLACQDNDYETLIQLEGEFWQYLTTEQINLIRYVVRSHMC